MFFKAPSWVSHLNLPKKRITGTRWHGAFFGTKGDSCNHPFLPKTPTWSVLVKAPCRTRRKRQRRSHVCLNQWDGSEIATGSLTNTWSVWELSKTSILLTLIPNDILQVFHFFSNSSIWFNQKKMAFGNHILGTGELVKVHQLPTYIWNQKKWGGEAKKLSCN